MRTKDERHDIGTIRELLLAAFTPQELRRFCLDRAFLRPVVREFAPEQGLSAMVDRVVDYCETHHLWDPLLTAVQEVNPHQYERFEGHLRISAAALAEIPCPYRGLEPFEAEHAEFYFGREAMVERLLGKVGKSGGLMAVVGSSGCGKSSLVRAGLMTALQEGALPGSQGWEARIFRPGTDPVRSLCRPLVTLLEPEATEVTRLTKLGELAKALREGTVTMADVAARLREKYPAVPCLLLVVDQFEEVYTECKDEDLRGLFVRALLAAAEQENISMVLTLRGDFYGNVLANLELGKKVDAGLVNVLPMSEEELREAIEKPAVKTGREFEPGLVERILEDVAEQPGNLPLMEFALAELWDRQTADGRLTHEAYEAIGKVEGAIAQRAEAAYEELVEQGQGETVKRIFLQLTHYGEGAEGTRREAMIDELATPRMSLNEVESTVRALADARLLVTGGKEPQKATAEVAHEALIRGWGRLGRWLDEDRAFGLWREKLAGVRRTWEETEQDEGALLRGAPLTEAEGWLAERRDDLNERELMFIDQSLVLQARTRRRTHWTVAALGILALLVFSGLAFIAIRESDRQAEQDIAFAMAATAEAVRAMSGTIVAEMSTVSVMEVASAASEQRSKYLATLSNLQLELTNDELALALAIEAVQAAGTDEARAALREILGRIPGTPAALSADMDTQIGELLEEACRQAPRNLSQEEWQRYMGDEPYQETCPGKPVPGRDF